MFSLWWSAINSAHRTESKCTRKVEEEEGGTDETASCTRLRVAVVAVGKNACVSILYEYILQRNCIRIVIRLTDWVRYVRRRRYTSTHSTGKLIHTERFQKWFYVLFIIGHGRLGLKSIPPLSFVDGGGGVHDTMISFYVSSLLLRFSGDNAYSVLFHSHLFRCEMIRLDTIVIDGVASSNQTTRKTKGSLFRL